VSMPYTGPSLMVRIFWGCSMICVYYLSLTCSP
jgi:hypothetical protein